MRIACSAIAVVMLVGVVGLIAKADWLFGFVNSFLATPSSFFNLNTILFSQNLVVIFGLLFYFVVAFTFGLGVATIKTNSHEGI